MPMADGSLKLNMATISTDAATAAGTESDGREVGIQYSGGFGQVSALQKH